MMSKLLDTERQATTAALLIGTLRVQHVAFLLTDETREAFAPGILPEVVEPGRLARGGEEGVDVEHAGSVHATADYQRHVAGVLTERALATANRRARDGH